MSRGKYAQRAANTAVKRTADEKVAAALLAERKAKEKLAKVEKKLETQRRINADLRVQIALKTSEQVRELQRQLLEMTVKERALLAGRKGVGK